MTDEEYQEAYQAGYEDGKALGDVWLSGPFVIVYINPKVPGEVLWSWRRVEHSTEAFALLEGIHEVAEDLEEMAEDSRPDDDDDNE